MYLLLLVALIIEDYAQVNFFKTLNITYYLLTSQTTDALILSKKEVRKSQKW